MANRLMDVDYDGGYDWYTVQQLISAVNGYANQGVPFRLDQVYEPSYYALEIQNHSTGTGHARIKASAGGTLVLVVDNGPIVGGVATTPASNFYGGVGISNGLGVANGLAVAGGITALTPGLIVGTGGIVNFADEFGDKIQLYGSSYGLAVESGKLVLYSNGTLSSPGSSGLVVASGAYDGTEYKVWHEGNDGHNSTLDADTTDSHHADVGGGDVGALAVYDVDGRVYDSARLEGHAASYFSTGSHTHSSDYVELAGDTMTGDLTINAELHVGGNVTLGDSDTDAVTITSGTSGFAIKNRSSAGKYTIGATNAADPDLQFKDNSGDTTFELHPSGSTWQAEVNGSLRVDTDLDVYGELYVDGNVQLGTVGTDAITILGEATFGDRINLGNSAGDNTYVSGVLDVTGNLYVDGGCTLGNASGDSHTINGSVTITRALSVDSGGVTSSLFGGNVTFQKDIYFTNGADLNLGSLSYLDTYEGDATNATKGGVNFDGYILAKHNGNIIRLYYWDN